MSEEPMTVIEMARMGGVARAKAHRKAELRKRGKRDGRSASLTGSLLPDFLSDASPRQESGGVGRSVRPFSASRPARRARGDETSLGEGIKPVRHSCRKLLASEKEQVEWRLFGGCRSVL